MRKHHVFNLALLAGLVVTGAACERDTRDRADRNLDEMNRRANEDVHELGREARDVGRDVGERAKDVGREVHERGAETARGVGDKTRELGQGITQEGRELREDVTGDRAPAQLDAAERETRIATLNAVVATTESQPAVIRALASATALTSTDRAAIDDKLQLLQARADEAKTLIGTLREVEPANWTARNEVIDDAMRRVDAARDDAWQALNDAADHTPSAMR